MVGWFSLFGFFFLSLSLFLVLACSTAEAKSRVGDIAGAAAAALGDDDAVHPAMHTLLCLFGLDRPPFFCSSFFPNLCFSGGDQLRTSGMREG